MNKFLGYMERLGVKEDDLMDVLKDYTCTSDFKRANKKLKKLL